MGSLPLVAAKLAAPLPPVAFLDRERLYRVLDQGLEATLTIVVGPAGAGKSALVAGWTASRAAEVDRAWVNADAGDTPVRLLRHIGHAVAGPGSATRQEPSPAGLHIDLVRRAGRRLVVVVDDVHLLRSRQAIELLGDLAAQSPPHVHVVLVSRSDPHVGATGRAGADVVEIRRPDLRLTDAEVDQILLAHEGLDLDAATRAEIARKVDGWAAGLQLALAVMARSDDPAEIAGAFGGSTPAVAEYLLDEVLGQLDEAERVLLLDASVLEDVGTDDRRLATGRDDVDDALAALADRNLMVERYTDGSFRCHPLLGQLLQLRLRQADPARFVRLHLLAATGAEERGDLAGAVDHLLAADASPAVLALCRRHAPDLLAAGAAPLLLGWIGRLAEDDLDDLDARLALATLLLEAGDVIGCGLRLERCRRAAGPTPPPEVARRLLELQGECHHRLGEPEPALRCARRARALAPGARPVPTVAAAEAFGLLWEGDLDAARTALATVPADDPERQGLAARIEVEAGDLQAARALVREAVTGDDGRPAGAAARLHAQVAHAQLVVERLEETDAEDVVDALIAEASRLGDRGATVVGLCLRARVRWAQICVSAGVGALGYRSRIGLDRPLGAQLQGRLDRTEARLLVEAGDLIEAHRLLDRSPDDRATAVVRCRAWAAAGDVGRALLGLAALDEHGDGGGAVALARARVLADDGSDRAPAEVARLLTRPATRHLRRAYLEEGPRLDAALRAAGPAGEALAAELDGTRRQAAATALSARELTVLRFLPTRLTNQEIGAQIYVSANTVKTHLKNLYRRLGVGTRDEAVRRGRELGLLPPGRDDVWFTAVLGPPERDRSPARGGAAPARRCG